MQEKPARWVEPFFVHSFDVNHLGLTTPVTMLKMMQEGAWKHAEALGFGYRDLKDEGSFWVLSRLQIRISHYPKWGNEFLLETWPSGAKSLLVSRDFRITDDDGIAAIATSSWIILDHKTRRPVRPLTVLEKSGPTEMGELLFGAMAEKVELPELSEGDDLWNESPPFMVRISALDSQGHVNNAKYLEWCLDAFSLEHFNQWEIRAATLNFLAETHYGDQIQVRTAEIDDEGSEDRLVTLQAIASKEGSPVFSCMLIWQRRVSE